MLININAVLLQPMRSRAFPEYILEHNPPKIYIPETRPAIVAVEPIEVAYSVTVDIKVYITRAEKSRAPKTRKNSFVKIFSSWLFIEFILFFNNFKYFENKRLN